MTENFRKPKPIVHQQAPSHDRLTTLKIKLDNNTNPSMGSIINYKNNLRKQSNHLKRDIYIYILLDPYLLWNILYKNCLLYKPPTCSISVVGNQNMEPHPPLKVLFFL